MISSSSPPTRPKDGGNESSQVDSDWSTDAPSRRRVASRLRVEYWHSDQDDVEVTEWLADADWPVDSALSTATPIRMRWT